MVLLAGSVLWKARAVFSKEQKASGDSVALSRTGQVAVLYD